MADLCPTCGQPMPTSNDVERVLWLLRKGRMMYKGADGSWWVDYSGGHVTLGVAEVVKRSSGVVAAYSDSNDCYIFGKTLDVHATQQRRRETGNGRILVYVDGQEDMRA